MSKPWLSILHAIGSSEFEATILYNLGRLADRHGQPDLARRYFERVLPLCRALRDQRIEADTLNNLGSLADRQGQYEQARQHYEQAMELLQKIGTVDEQHIVDEQLKAVLEKI